MIYINNFLNKPLNKFILWLLTGLLIIFVGIFPVKADTLFNNNTLHFYNNNGSSYNDVGTSYIEQTDESWTTLTTVAGSYGGLVAIQLSSPLIQGHIYTLYLNVGAESNGGQTRLSSKNCLGIGGSDNSANNSYLNCEISPRFSDYSTSTGDKTRGVYYTFIANKNGIILSVPYTSQYTCNGCRNYSYGYTLQDNGDSSVLTQAQINTIINNQTASIQNQITQSQSVTNQTIIDSANNTNQTIIDSANNTDSNIVNSANATQDTINNGLQTCTKQFKFILKKGKAFTTSGSLYDDENSYYTEDYYSIGNAKEFTFSNVGFEEKVGNIIFYDSNKNYIDYWGILDRTFNIGNINAAYFRLSTIAPNINLYEGKGCTSKIDAVNDTLNDDDVDSSNATDTLTNLSNSTASNSVISDLLLLPVRLFQNIVNSINGSCSPFNLGTLYNTSLTLPCINIPNLIGNTLWSIIDILFCGSFILVIRKKFVDIFENLSELKNGGNEVE